MLAADDNEKEQEQQEEQEQQQSRVLDKGCGGGNGPRRKRGHQRQPLNGLLEADSWFLIRIQKEKSISDKE